MSEVIIDLVDTPDEGLIASLTTMVLLGASSFTATEKQAEEEVEVRGNPVVIGRSYESVSGYRNITFNSKRGIYNAYLRINGVMKYVGADKDPTVLYRIQKKYCEDNGLDFIEEDR